MLLIKIKTIFLKILLTYIPTYLFHGLGYFFLGGIHQKRLLPTSPATKDDVRRTYDLLNCGNNHSFTIGYNNPLVVHNCQYGMGAGKLHKELNIAGFDISFIEAKSLWDSYWESFRGIKVFERELKRQWTENGGWIRGIRGEPITIPKPYRYRDKETGKYETIDYTKDIVNRFVQRGGHNIHMRFIYHINSLRLSHCPAMVPFHVDLHDSTTWQVPEDKVDTAKEIYTEACDRLNSELGWDVKIKYKPKIGTTMESFLED